MNTNVSNQEATIAASRAAEAVGQKLKALSRVQQVLCVTHLPQIAAFADQHILIEKREKPGQQAYPSTRSFLLRRQC